MRTAAPAGALLCAFLLMGTSAAQATTINVQTFASGQATDGLCSLSEAVAAVNQQAQVRECNGAGATYIQLESGTYSIPAGLFISREVTIGGRGLTLTKLTTNGASSWYGIQIAGGVSGTVTMQNLTLQGVSPLQQELTGLYIGSASSATLNLVRVTGFNGGGIWNALGDLTLNRSIVDFNINWSGIWIEGFGPDGGGVNWLNHSTVSNNSCNQFGGDGGGIHNLGYLNLQHSTVSNNTATGRGGGIFNAQGPPNGGSYLELHHATIAFNSAATGGGVFLDPSVSNYMVQASIVASNTASNAPDYSGPLRSQAVTPDPNFIGNTSGLTSGAFTSADLSGNARLGSLFDMGGITKTVYLNSNSPAINKSLDDGSSQDQRAFSSPVGSKRDIGAYEFDSSWQLESLSAQWSNDLLLTQFDSGFRQDYGMILFADANNDFVTFQVPVPVGGSFPIKVRVQKGNNRGKFQLSVADSINGPFTNVGNAQDLYASSSSFTELTVTSSRTFTSGQKFFKFTVVTKNSASSGNHLYLDTIRLS